MLDMLDLRTRLTDLIYGTVSWRDVNVPVAEEVADAVIRELRLEALAGLARSWYRTYDRCPTGVDVDIAYADAGLLILEALGLADECMLRYSRG